MFVGVGVDVFVGVAVGVSVGEDVAVGVDVFVGVGVDVFVGVAEAVGVCVGVLVGVFVGVFVGVCVLVGVTVGVAVGSRSLALKTTSTDRREPKLSRVIRFRVGLLGQGIIGLPLYFAGYSTSKKASSPGRKLMFLEKFRYPSRPVIFCSRPPSGRMNVIRAPGSGKSGPLLKNVSHPPRSTRSTNTNTVILA